MESSDRPCGLALQRPTLVLNRSWVPIHVTTARRALVLVYREAALVVESESYRVLDFASWLADGLASHAVRAPDLVVPIPEVVQLLSYDRVPSYEAPFTRRNLFQRDNFTCQYCGERVRNDKLSIDHVKPRSKGGKTSWENCVLACVRCNAFKGDRTLRESGLRLRRMPQPPRWTPYLNLRPSQWLASWEPFTRTSRSRTAANR